MRFIRPELVVGFIYFLYFFSDSVIYNSTFNIISAEPFHWRPQNIYHFKNVVTGLEFTFILLTGIFAAFFCRIRILYIFGVLFYYIGFIILNVTFQLNSHESNNSIIAPSQNTTLFNENNFIQFMFGFLFISGYYGIFRVILPILILDQVPRKRTHYALCIYNVALNSGQLFSNIFMPEFDVTQLSTYVDSHYYTSLSITTIGVLIFIIGYLFSIFKIKVRKTRGLSLIYKNENDHLPLDKVPGESIISISKLILVFFILLPYGVCEYQLYSTFVLQSLQMKETLRKVFKPKYLVDNISSITILVFVALLTLLRQISQKFRTFYSSKIRNIIIGKLLMLLTFVTASLVEFLRLNIYWGWDKTTLEPALNSFVISIYGRNYTVADLNAGWLIPQTSLQSISGFLIVVMCGQFMYLRVKGSFKYLAIALLVGVLGNGGAGSVVNILVCQITNLYNSTDINFRQPNENGTCCQYESQLYKLYCYLTVVAILFFILTIFILKRFQFYFNEKSGNCELHTNYLNTTISQSTLDRSEAESSIVFD